MSTLKAVSFDLWDTILDDGSDEPKRAARGLRTKGAERRHLLWEALQPLGAVSLDDVGKAFDAADDAFDKMWRVNSVTWTITERLETALMWLDRELPDDEIENLSRKIGRMELEVMPGLVAGIADAVKALAGTYKLCIVSDAIVSPAPSLRMLLERHDLSRYFQGFAFSDEVGRAKPHRSMFDSAANQLDVALGEMVHVGDREVNDIEGAKALGMRAVLFTAKRPQATPKTAADMVCASAEKLPGTIESLARIVPMG